MKLTKSQLKRIIKEELQNILQEQLDQPWEPPVAQQIRSTGGGDVRAPWRGGYANPETKAFHVDVLKAYNAFAEVIHSRPLTACSDPKLNKQKQHMFEYEVAEFLHNKINAYFRCEEELGKMEKWSRSNPRPSRFSSESPAERAQQTNEPK